MKKFSVLCLLLLSLPAFSQVEFGVQGNVMSAQMNATLRKLVDPSNPSPVSIALEEVYGLGVGGGVHLDVDLGLLSFRLSGDYLTLSPDKDKFTSFIKTIFPGANIEFLEGGRVSLITGTVNAKFVFVPLPVVKPYLTGGGGVANVTSADVKLRFNGSELSPFKVLKDQTVGTLNVGVGVDLEVGGLAIFGELRVNKIFLEEGSGTFLPIATVGLTF